ncbi:MAG: S1 family peptidase [Calditrichia bacterium]
MARACLILIVLLLAILSTGCQKTVIAPHQRIVDGKYDIGFPLDYKPEVIERLMESVQLLNAHVFYDRYSFEASDGIVPGRITKNLLKEKKNTRSVYQDFSVGTATLIYHQSLRVALLTCAHVVDFPDTLYEFYASDNPANAIVSSVSIKKRQTNRLVNFRYNAEFELIAVDRDNDIAIMGGRLDEPPQLPLPVLRLPTGSARELSWGNFVYMLGYPAGKKMITSGIISSPNRNREHDFLVDGMFNRGFSGGIVLALRDGMPNFELVGILTSVAAEEEIILAPTPGTDYAAFPVHRPYRDNLYFRERKLIKYGVTFGVSIESILKLLEKRDQYLRDQGYDTGAFFR